MKVLAIEIVSNDALMVFVEGNKSEFTVTKHGTFLSIPAQSDDIKGIIEFQINFSMFLQENPVDLVVLCEGGSDSKKKRVRMEFSILSECERKSINYKTYATSACTKIINSIFKKETDFDFSEVLVNQKLPKSAAKAFAAGWKFISTYGS